MKILVFLYNHFELLCLYNNVIFFFGIKSFRFGFLIGNSLVVLWFLVVEGFFGNGNFWVYCGNNVVYFWY